MLRSAALRRLLVPLCLSATLVGCAFKNAMSRGDDALKAGNYDAAVAEYTHAVQLDPDSAEARAGLETAKRGAVTARIAEARAALQRGDLRMAARDAGESQRLLRDDVEVVRLVADVGAAVLHSGDAAVSAGRFFQTRGLYAELRELLPALGAQLADADARAVTAWVAQLTKQRDAAQKAGRNGDALLAERQLIELQPTAVGRAHCTQLVQALRDRTEVVVGLEPLDSDDPHALDDAPPPVNAPKPPKPGPHGGPAGGHHEGRHFNKHYLPLARGLAAVGTTQWLRVLSPDDSNDNARAILRFGVSEPRFETDQRTDRRSAQYQTGTRQVPSPFFAEKQRNVLDQERRVTNAEEEVTRQQRYVEQYTADVKREGDTPNVTTGAEQNLMNAQSALEAARRILSDERARLQTARDELQRQPPFVTEPVYATWTYDVVTYTVHALSRLVARIEWQGQPGAAATFPLGVDATDASYAAQPPLGLAADPITLPAERDMVGGLMKVAANQLQAQIQAIFARATQTQRSFAISLDGDTRVEELVAYLLLDKGVVDHEVDQLLFELRGIPNASTLLDSCGMSAQ